MSLRRLWWAIGCMTLICRTIIADDLPNHVPFYSDKTRLLEYIDEDGQTHPIDAADQWTRRRLHIVGNMEKVMGQLPTDVRRVPLDVRVIENVAKQGNYEQREISFAVEPGDRAHGYLLLPHGAKRRPAVLCLHQTNQFGSAESVGLAGRPSIHYGKELAQRGYVTLSVDYPNFGQYKFNAYEHGYFSATMKGIWNHMRAVDLLQSLDEVDAERIGVIGHSLGGHNGLFVAVFDDRIRCVVSSCGFCSFSRYYGGDLTGWSHQGYMPRIADAYQRNPAKMPFDFTEVVAAIAPRPFLAVAPQRDANFDVEGVRECIAAAEPVYNLLGADDLLKALYPDAEHDFPDAERTAAYEWFDRWLNDGRRPD